MGLHSSEPSGIIAASQIVRWLLMVVPAFNTACIGEIRVADGSTDPPCSGDSDCPAGACLFVDGRAGSAICGSLCQAQDDCETGTTCAPVRTATEEVKTACLPSIPSGKNPGAPCSTGADCATRLCHEALCVQACSSCKDGQVCEPVSIEVDGDAVEIPVCRWRVNWSPLELGGFDTPVTGSEEISFAVPSGQASFVIILVDNEMLRVAVKSLIAPDGTVLIDVDDGAADLNPGFSFPGIAATLVPSTDAPVAQPRAGIYRMRVGTYEPANFAELISLAGNVEHSVVTFEPQGEQGGLLDLNLHFAPGTGLVATNAAANAFVKEMLAAFESLYLNSAQVRLGAVRFLDLPPEQDVVESGDQIRALLSKYSAPGPHGASVNIFLVKDITFTSGYAAGIPGPPGFYGTVASGVVAEAQDNGRDTGVLLAHETGHYLGLFHTTELTGGRHDPILDTPECAGGSQITDCADYTNLMFPVFPLDRDLSLTPGQAKVLRGNPTLYEVDRTAACEVAGVAYDLTETGFATGNTSRLADRLAGSCGGAGAPERMHFYRTGGAGAATLEIHLFGLDFAPVVYVRQDRCADEVAEIACQAGALATELVFRVNPSSAGPLFIAVDGQDGQGGTFIIEIFKVSP